MKFNSDIDIDFADRNLILKYISYTNAAMRKVNPPRKHPSGIYVTNVPYNPIDNMCSVDYTDAEQRGYFKLDLLNVSVYEHVKDEEHLLELMGDPDWEKLYDRGFFEQIVHIGNHYDTMLKMPEPINSVPRLAMFLSIIRPGKKHLIGNTWVEIAKTVWEESKDGYTFKRSHSIAYSNLVCVHMNLLCEKQLLR